MDGGWLSALWSTAVIGPVPLWGNLGGAGLFSSRRSPNGWPAGPLLAGRGGWRGSSRRPPPALGRWRLRGGGPPIPGLCRLSLVSPIVRRRRPANASTVPPFGGRHMRLAQPPGHRPPPTSYLHRLPPAAPANRPHRQRLPRPLLHRQRQTSTPTVTPTLNREGAL